MTARLRECAGGRGRLASYAIIAALAALPAFSCWQPAFDPALSASTVTASKMTLAATISIDGTPERLSSPGLFLPRRVAAPPDGVWLNGDGADGYEFESASAWYLGAATAASVFADWNNGVHFAANPAGLPVARMSPALLGSDPLEIVAAAAWYDTWAAARLYQPSEKPAAMAADLASPTLPVPGRLLGAGMTSETAVSDAMCLIYFDASLGEWRAGELPVPYVSPAAITSQAVTMPGDLDTDSIRGVGFAARKGADYYLSVTDDDGATRAFRWSAGLAAPPAELAGVDAPLLAVLRDGTLLSGDGMTMTARRADGAALYAFPSGALRFVHERYDAVNETWKAVFTRTMFAGAQDDDRGEFRAEVYELPIADLATLEP